MCISRRILALLVCVLSVPMAAGSACAQGIVSTVFPEQRRMEIRDPAQFPRARLPDVPLPPTVARPDVAREPFHVSLDEAIRMALENSEVVRVLTGAGATSSGSTIYDPAITNTQIDQARAVFDPALGVSNTFDQTDSPTAIGRRKTPNVFNRFTGTKVDSYNMDFGLSKQTATGGTASLGVRTTPSRSNAASSILNPQTRSTVDMRFEQPLLQGGGTRANLVPIEIARIDTERSFYQLKASVQQLVRGVIDAYWAVVFARVDVWSREQLVKQGQWAFDQAEARLRHDLGDAGDAAQARSSLAGFRANLITSQASLLTREAALRNILGLPPVDGRELVPVTPPFDEWIDVDWETILRTAEENRPDLIERKLACEADEQQLLLANNDALPDVTASALYRWDRLSGRASNDDFVFSDPGQFTGWQLGIDVSLPLGLRRSRAALRQRELILMRDRANLQQALHNATHILAENYRSLAQFYEQHQAFQETRKASRTNLDAQSARWAADLTIYLNVLQALTSWGNAIDSEAQSLLQYNTEFANLQEQMGTILEEHGVRFVEERFPSIGPAGRIFHPRWYPQSRRPGPNADQYESTSAPAEDVFQLQEPVVPSRKELDRRLPPVPKLDLESDFPMQPLPDAERLPLGVPTPEPGQVPTPSPQQEPDRLIQPMPDVELPPLGVPAVPDLDPVPSLTPRAEPMPAPVP